MKQKRPVSTHWKSEGEAVDYVDFSGAIKVKLLRWRGYRSKAPMPRRRARPRRFGLGPGMFA